MLTTFFFCEKKNFVSTKKSIMPCIQKRTSLGKKGSGELLFFFAVFMIIMGSVLMYELFKQRAETTDKIGETQAGVLKLYFESEEKRLGKEMIVELAVNDALIEMGENGGFSKDNICERSNGKIIWDFEMCWPDVEKNFGLLIERKMKERKIEYKSLKIENNELVIELNEEEINGDFGNAHLNYTRGLILKKKIEIDFKKIQELKRKLIDAKNKGDYSGIGKVENGYIPLSIENDKKAFLLKPGKGIEIEKRDFVFILKVV